LKKFLIKVILPTIFIFNPVTSKEITLAVSSNLTFVMGELIEKFNDKYRDIEVKYRIGSSGKLANQIIHGANYSIFLSANREYPLKLYKMGIGLNKPKTYAEGILVAISNSLPLNRFKDILNAKRVAVANPKTAPYGKAGVEAMKKAKIFKELKGKIVYSESVAQTYYYLLKGLVEVSLIAKSSIYNKRDEIKYTIEVDRNLYSKIAQDALLLKSKNGALEFYNFLFTKEAKAIFVKYGYR
jgi:molybdate transport system substrate-binding protein